MEKINEMLEEAGETFTEKEAELAQLRNVITRHEVKIKQQVIVSVAILSFARTSLNDAEV